MGLRNSLKDYLVREKLPNAEKTARSEPHGVVYLLKCSILEECLDTSKAKTKFRARATYL